MKTEMKATEQQVDRYCLECFQTHNGGYKVHLCDLHKAAPELLAALKAALNEITGEVDKCPDPLPMIRATIAKAEGRV